MQAILLIGLQGAWKSTLYQQRFSNTHLRLSLDMLKTRHRLKLLLDACLAAKHPFVIDSTNPTRPIPHQAWYDYINAANPSELVP